MLHNCISRLWVITVGRTTNNLRRTSRSYKRSVSPIHSSLYPLKPLFPTPFGSLPPLRKLASGVERAMVLLLSYILPALAWTAFYPTVSAIRFDRNQIKAIQHQAAERFNKNRLSVLPGADPIDVKLNAGVKNITFSNPAASGAWS